ncbi:hypothetical protein [Nostoc sp.]|uniref:hypothetical protein n=1 Tax=Nostoc sp. TaxID=1180 RepID=UPI002FFCE817
MNLEQMIDVAYSEYQQELRVREQKQQALEQAKIQEATARLRRLLDEIIPSELQSGLEIEFFAQLHDSAIAKFTYKGTQFNIKYGPYNGGEWGVSKGFEGYLSHVRSEELLNYLLIQMGEIRASFAEPEPQSMAIEQAADILEDCLNLADRVYTHRHDFIHNSEEFGSSLKAAICLMSKLLDDLAESEDQAE